MQAPVSVAMSTRFCILLLRKANRVRECEPPSHRSKHFDRFFCHGVKTSSGRSAFHHPLSVAQITPKVDFKVFHGRFKCPNAAAAPAMSDFMLIMFVLRDTPGDT